MRLLLVILLLSGFYLNSLAKQYKLRLTEKLTKIDPNTGYTTSNIVSHELVCNISGYMTKDTMEGVMQIQRNYHIRNSKSNEKAFDVIEKQIKPQEEEMKKQSRTKKNSTTYVIFSNVITEIIMGTENPGPNTEPEEFTITYPGSDGLNMLKRATICRKENIIKIPITIMKKIQIKVYKFYKEPWKSVDAIKREYSWQPSLDRTSKYIEVQENVPRQKGYLRIVCISDTHSYHQNMAKFKNTIPHGDVLIHAGDFTHFGKLDEVRSFNDFMGGLPHKHKIVIAGNHDYTLDPNFSYHKKPVGVTPAQVREALTNCIYLEDAGIQIEGLNFYGTPWQPIDFVPNDGSFNAKRGEEIIMKWLNIPRNTDILISHTPPFLHGDVVFIKGNYNESHGPDTNVAVVEKRNVGCLDLLQSVEVIQPILHIFGHVHEAYGSSSNKYTAFLNASSCTDKYEPTNKPWVFDVLIPKQ